MNSMNYFEDRARDYENRSERGLWRRVRAREWHVIETLLDPRAGETVVDLGCGAGFYATRLQDAGLKVIGIDRTPAMVAAAVQAGVSAFEADAEEFVANRPVDKMLAAGMFEFVERPERVFANCRAGLKPGGIMVILVPRVGLGGRLYKAAHEYRGCGVLLRTPNFYRESATRAGLRPGPRLSPTPFSMAMAFSAD